jgi:uncharacterized membrane protein
MALVYAIYFTWIDNFLYSTYQLLFYDFGAEIYSVYWHLYGIPQLNMFNVLQYLVFQNHLSPFSLLLVPIFALYPYPVTLIAMQALAVSLTSIVVYLVAKEIVKRNDISFALAFAFLLNPGVSGILLNPIHNEGFIPLFYVLTFYFFVKAKKFQFLASLVLLLSIMEESTPVAGSLLIGCLAYEYIYGRKNDVNSSKLKMQMLLYGLGLTAIAAVAYYAIGSYLTYSYTTTSFSAVPPLIRYGNFLSTTSINAYSQQGNYGTLILGVEGLVIIFVGIGFGALRNPLLSAIFYLPWLVAVFILNNSTVADPLGHFYAFVVGGSAVASLLGYAILLRSKRPVKSGAIGIFSSQTIISVALALALVSDLTGSFIILKTTTPYNYSQINSALAMIPKNSTVMSQDDILPHLYYIKYIEFQPFPNQSYFPSGALANWFTPDYIVVYYNTSGRAIISGVSPISMLKYVNSSYSLYYNQSQLMIFKKNGKI